MRQGSGGLWRHPDFLKLWAGETISLFGSSITTMALPLAAVLAFDANSLQMGLLNAAGFAPNLLVTLAAGVWIDRTRRRPVMIAANIGRGLLLGIIPLTYLLGLLRLEHLYVVTFLTGVLTVLFELAYQAYLPSLVERADLVEGNGKLQGSASVAQVSGPGLAGLLVSLLGAPVAILLDAVSYLFSAASLGLIRRDEPQPPPAVRQPGELLRDVRTGLRLVFRNRYLRALAAEAATFNLGLQVIFSVLVLYMTRELQISPSGQGLVMAIAGVGSVLGATIAGRLGRRFGPGPTIIVAMTLACAAPLLLPLAHGAQPMAVTVLTAALFLLWGGVVIANIHLMSLRQAIVPPHLLGRVAAATRFVVVGGAPIGALLGGALGSVIGLRLTLLVGALGTLAALGILLCSPVRQLRALPLPLQEEPSAEPAIAASAHT